MRQIPPEERDDATASIVQLSSKDPRGRANDWLLAAAAAEQAAGDLRSVGLALQTAQRGEDGEWIVPDGTRARMQRARAKASLLIDLVARSLR